MIRKTIVFAACITSAAAGEIGCRLPDPKPSPSWEVTLDSGYLWQVGHNTDNDYEAIPTLVSLLSPEMFTLWDGKITVRNRFTLIHEAYTVGPEDYYLGVAAAPSLEAEVFDSFTTAFFSIGGGAGWINSSGGTDGQGQDLAFNWFAHLGLRRQVFENLTISAGAYFTHHSNLGMTDPNPGMDLLGFTVGLGWKF